MWHAGDQAGEGCRSGITVTRGDEKNSACGMLATKRVKVAAQG